MKIISYFYFTATIFFLSHLPTSAQFITEFTTGRAIQTSKKIEISGSAYFNEEWRTGFVENAMSERTTELKLRYNALDDLFEVLHEGEIFVLKNSVVRKCVFLPESGFNEIVFRNGFWNVGEKYNPLAYYIVHYDGQSKLLEKISIRLSEEIVPGYSQSKIEKRYAPVSVYWIVSPEGISSKIPLKEKHLLAVLKDRNKEVLSFIKSNKLSIRNPEEVAMVLEYYDSIRN